MSTNRMMCITVMQDRNGCSYELPPSRLKRKRGHVNRANTVEQGEAEWALLTELAERHAARRRMANRTRWQLFVDLFVRTRPVGARTWFRAAWKVVTK